MELLFRAAGGGADMAASQADATELQPSPEERLPLTAPSAGSQAAGHKVGPYRLLCLLGAARKAVFER